MPRRPMMSSTTTPLLPSYTQPPQQHAPSTPATTQRQALLRHLTLSALPNSPISALFFAERLHALDAHSNEPATFLLALVLHRNHRFNEAIWILRQPLSFQPDPTSAPSHHSSTYNDNPFAPSTSNNPARRWPTNARIVRPAVECSVRCARLYAQCCLALNRDKEGRDVLAKVLLPGVPLISPDATLDTNQLFSILGPDLNNNNTDPHVVDLELARLAQRAGEHERAIQSYRKVLEANPWCWEALEGLCAEGAPPDPDVLYPPRPRPPHSQPISPLPNATASSSTTSRPLQPLPSHPPPLGPSQNSTVNSSFSFNKVPARGASGGGAGMMGDGLGFFTPSDTSTPVMMGGGGAVNKGKGAGLFGGSWQKGNVGQGRRGGDMSEMSVDESNSSIDASFYPQQPLSFAPTNTAILPTYSNNNVHPSSSSSLFTPPTTTSLAVGAAPGVKRTRGGAPQATSSSTLTHTTPDEDNKSTSRRVVRGVPNGGGEPRRRDSSLVAAPGTRRSSRLSRDTGSSQGINLGGPSSTGMVLSRSQATNTSSTSNGGGGGAPATGTRSAKKRSKAGAGPSVLSDAGSDALSPVSHSSSPGPSSPGATQHAPLQQIALDPGVQEAEDYVATLMRCFGRAATYAAKYESAKSVEALLALPHEQQRTWRCLVGIGKAHLEMLNYERAREAFSQARQLAPHLLDSMELYSTLLWHLRSSTGLSYLAQDLMLIAPRSPAAWIASGNVFSHLEDHASALKCFKRAAQLDENCVYAYTLSGHECVVLEEWERALGFFREAVRRDQRHYNAWFGLGNVYMQTGKYRLAEYHFRKAAEINPTNATLVCCVGSVLEKLGRRRDALELYERACVLAPESPAVRFKRVRILIHLKRFELAESDLLNLKDRAPNEFNVHFMLGKLYKLLGRTQDMLKHFMLAQDLEPRTASMIREQIDREVGEPGMDVDEGESMLV